MGERILEAVRTNRADWAERSASAANCSFV
jgi:hypothetical protein